MSAPLVEGAMGVLTRDTESLTGGRALRKGDRFIVEDYVSASEAEDGIAFYWGSSNGGMNNVTVVADAVEQVMDASEVANRQLPSLKSLAAYVCSLDSGDGFEFDEGDYSHVVDKPQSPEQCQVHLYGETDEGLRFAMTVQIISVTETDL